MSTVIPPKPNAIIATLLDIAQAAYVLAHSPSKETADNLKARVDDLEMLPQYCNNPVNGPARARHYLQSFLESGASLATAEEDDVARLMQRRTPKFAMPTLVVTCDSWSSEEKANLMRVLEQMKSKPLQAGEFFTASADVQRDAIGFEVTQEWKAPTTLRIQPEFTPTAEFPASGPISHDFYTHRDSWRDIIVKCIEQTKGGRTIDHARDLSHIDADTSYLEHELRAFDRAFGTLPPELPASLKQQTNILAPELDHRANPQDSKAAMIDATRPLFVKAMKTGKHRADLDANGNYIGVSEYRWEGWVAAVEAMGFKPARDELLADTIEEAHKIVNDAGLLANLNDLFKLEPFAEVSIRDIKGGGWAVYVDPFDEDTKPRSYTSTSMHQAIVVAHKGENDLKYPEPQ